MNETIQPLMDKSWLIIDALHFIRADWFFAFIPLLVFLLLSYRKSTSDKNWATIIDPQLLPFVLTKKAGKQRRYPLLLVFIAVSLCITALAGPVYKKLPQPVYREQSSLIVLLDLSQSMNATDIKPSRLSRTKLELLDLLKTRNAGQTALIVYAADAFAVTPLTDDNATIANLVPALDTEMMPAQGSNLSTALAKAFSLFTQSGIMKGDILVFTDDIHKREESAIKKVSSQGHRLSIFGIGTHQGAPIPLSEALGGGFLQDSNGAIVVPTLQPAKLQNYALQGGGLYVSLQADDSDTGTLNRLFQSSIIKQNSNTDDLNADIWQEEGHWLLLPLLFFAALWTRKGWLAIFLLFLLPVPQPAYAESSLIPDIIIDSQHLWSSPDQKAMKAFNAGDNNNAARQFTRPEWKASALYREGNYEDAIKVLQDSDNSDSLYNKGNALAKLGKYEDAIKAYDQALELDKNNADANYNREQVKNVLQKQQEQQQKNKQQDQSDKGESEQQSEQKNKKNSGEKNKQKNSDEEKSTSSDSSQEDNGEQKNKQPEESDEKNSDKQQSQSQQQEQAENEQLKKRNAKEEEKQRQTEQKQYEQDQNKDKSQQKNNSVENNENNEKNPLEIEANPLEASITEDEKATKQWLKRIPDDPGGLLRRKFYYQYKNNTNQNDSNEPW